MEIDGNEIGDEIAWQGSSLLLRGPEPALCISVKVVREVVRGWMSRKHEEYWQSVHGQRHAQDFIKNTLC
jgi:hypothetical protein